MNNDNMISPLDTTTFLRVRKWYLLALATIALTIIIAQILIQHHLNSQLDDFRVINVAGRQRAYSQKLTKEVLLLKETDGIVQRNLVLSQLRETLATWKKSHQALQFGDLDFGIPKGDNDEIKALFKKLDPHHNNMVGAVERILANTDQNALPNQTDVNILLQNERDFLSVMDTIVNKYDSLSETQLKNLKYKEYFLLGISLLILLLEILFIFKPLSLQIRNTIKNLIIAQRTSEENNQEIKKLYQEKEKSLQELQELNFVIDNAALFASTKQDGNVVFISKKFNELLGHDNDQHLNKPLYEILTTDEGQQQYLMEILKSNRKNIRSEEIRIKTTKGEALWLDMSIIPMHQTGGPQSILILCSDITERKQNQLKVAELTKQNYEETMRQKQLQASQIVEGQEEERKRIAKDIHDGIGQMLTALKFNIESINLENREKTVEKIEY
ncbi:MAG: PAS domain S-box protein, partial [Arenibacter sp.]|nr:PAS domain S-box protein [Arenibacter sp.]